LLGRIHLGHVRSDLNLTLTHVIIFNFKCSTEI
jgi:hypothetical protein